MNAFVETSFPTVLLYLLAGYLFAPAVFGTWTALLYFLFIILSTLRLNFALSAFTGAVAAVELFASLRSPCILAGEPKTQTSASDIT